MYRLPPKPRSFCSPPISALTLLQPRAGFALQHRIYVPRFFRASSAIWPNLRRLLLLSSSKATWHGNSS